MKPVQKGPAPRRYSAYGEAKPDLIDRLGPHCSYCEVHGQPTALDVEHIYPQKAHHERATQWENFLIACKSCNSKKNSHLGPGRQRGLHQRYLWPHLDNTARAFVYSSDGRVSVAANLPASMQKLAEKTMEMAGFMSNPAAARKYSQRAIAYSGVSIRHEIWGQAESIKADYLANPLPTHAQSLANLAAKIGYFSVWMQVFHDRPDFRRELIRAFKADPQCFDHATQGVQRGRV
jgi:uncharacterized protein (TIGR02646 family)